MRIDGGILDSDTLQEIQVHSNTGICLKPCPQGLSSFVLISTSIFSLMVKADVQCISQNDFPIPQYVNISSVISCFDYRSSARSKCLPLGARVVGPSCPVVLSLLFYIYFFASLSILGGTDQT